MNKAEQEQAKVFQQGVNAMREYFATEMGKYGKHQAFSGPDIAVIIRRVKGPQFADAASISPTAS